ncbi:hypothetical protein MRY87_05800 [bacterium]|nr:hypothetical protein [bacterium]
MPIREKEQRSGTLDLTQLGVPELTGEFVSKHINDLRTLYGALEEGSELSGVRKLAQQRARAARVALHEVQQADEQGGDYLKRLRDAVLNNLNANSAELAVVNYRRLNGYDTERIERFSEEELSSLFTSSLRLHLLKTLELSPEQLLEQIFADEDLVKEIHGPRGYRKISSLLYGDRMRVAHDEVRKFCKKHGKNFRALEWPGMYFGRSTEYREKTTWLKKNFSSLIQHECPPQEAPFTTIPEKIKGIWGYIAFAEAVCGGNMSLAFTNMSVLCKAAGVSFRDLGWPSQFKGTSSEYREEIRWVKENFSSLTAADECVPQEEPFTEIPTNLRGLWGYIAFAEAKYGGDMQRAFMNMSALCKAAGMNFKMLGWPSKFNGNSSTYRQEIHWLKQNFSSLVSEECPIQGKRCAVLPKFLKGLWGYIAFAEAEYGGDMQKAFSNMSALCKAAGLEFKELGWPNQFHGNSRTYRRKIRWLSENFSSLTEKKCRSQQKTFRALPKSLRGVWGCVAFAEVEYDGDMQKAFSNMSALCKAANLDFQELEWPSQFHGSSTTYRHKIRWIRENFSHLTGGETKEEEKFTTLPESLRGLWGYIAVAEVEYKGDLHRAFTNMHALCEGAELEFKQLKWPQIFRGNTAEYREKMRWLKKNFGTLTQDECRPREEVFMLLPENLKGLWGQIAFAEAEYNGDMGKAFRNMSALCDATHLSFLAFEWPEHLTENTQTTRSRLAA